MSSTGNLASRNPFNSTYPLICCVTDLIGLASRQAQERFLQGILRSGVDLIQLREKTASDLQVFGWMQGLVCGREGASPGILVNTRMDMAVAADADGVHLSATSLPIGLVRSCLGQDRLIGKSVHSQPEAVAAWQEGADYLFFGPVFETPSKARWGTPQGLLKLGEVCRLVPLPVFGIGGIHPGNAGAVIACGARGVAAIGWFRDADDPAARFRELADALGRNPG